MDAAANRNVAQEITTSYTPTPSFLAWRNYYAHIALSRLQEARCFQEAI